MRSMTVTHQYCCRSHYVLRTISELNILTHQRFSIILFGALAGVFDEQHDFFVEFFCEIGGDVVDI